MAPLQMSPRWLSLASCAGLLCLLDCFGGSCSAAAENVTLCWGDGSYGQLGNGQGNFTEQSYNSSVPVEVVGGRSFAAVCSGEAHTCALEPSGAAWCWGDNQFSQLGTGDNVNSTTPVAVAGGRAFRYLTCGLGFTCALDSEDQAWCWGRNNYGQLGTGDQTSWKVPVEVAPGRRFAALSAGSAHTCGVDLEGATFCWGLNEFGQLGAQLSSSDSFTPVEVTGNHTFVDVSSGLAHTCALEPPPSSRAWCWGWGTFGQLGNRETGDQRSPVLVAGNRAFSLISVGGGHSCALASNGATWCWGIADANGQGNATEQPRLVGGNHMFVTLTTGGLHTCALDVSKNAWCWGSNDTGWTGTGTLGTASTMPVQVAAGRSFLAIEAGDRHTCAIVAKAAGQDEVPSPQPSPVPSPSPPPVSSSSSSTPVGAIVGGTCAGAAVLAALAFFALRPRKGWLRRKRPPASIEDASSSDKDTMHDTPLKGSHGASASMHHGGSSPPSTMPGAAASAASGSELGPGTLSPRSRVADGVLLQLSSSGSGAGSTSAAAASPTHAALTQTDSQTSSASDALLSFISSYLSSYPRQTTQPATPMQVGGSGSGSGGSGSLELLADPQLRNVQWPELTIVRRVGRGSFGSVYVAEWKRIHVAVKLLVSQDSIERGQLELPDKVVRDLHAEAAIMNRMRHPNVVQFMGVVDVPPALITEYCSRGSLYDCLATAREHATTAAHLTWRRRLAMAVDAGAGLLYLHSLSIIHRDVKSPNMLVDEHWRVKVADFNLSKLLENSSLTSTAATNPIWLAPEVLRGDKATTASDVYSFGMVLYELLTWRLPWTMAEMSPFKIAAVVRRGGRPEVPPREALPGADTAGWDGLDDYVQLMRMCWAPQPEHRPSFDEVVQQLQLLKGAAPPPEGQAGRL